MSRTRITAVITRSLTKDYGYLGAPGSEWWAEAARFVDLDEVAVLAWRDDTGLWLLVSGIPSARKDSANRPIRVTLVLEGDDQPAMLGELVRSVLDDSGRAELGARLDTAVTETVVDDLRGARDRPLGDLAEAVLDAVRPEPGDQRERQDQPGSWVGAVHDPESVDCFLARFDALLASHTSGYALATHKVVSEDGAARAREALDPDIAVLTLSDQSRVKGLTRLGKGEGPSPAPRRQTVLIGTAATCLVLVVALLLWLV